MATVKLILFSSLCCFLFRCNRNSDEVKFDTADSVGLQTLLAAKSVSLPLANYMRIKDGVFQRGSEDGIPFTSRADLKHTFDHLLTSDSNLVVYFHGGFMSVKKAFSTPIEIKLDSTFRSAGYFPFYVLYGASVKESLWTDRPTRFDESEPVQEFLNSDQQIDFLTEQAVNQKSFIYLSKQIDLRVKHEETSLSPYFYTTLDTSDLQLNDLSLGNNLIEQESQDNVIQISPAEEDSFINSLENDKVLANLEAQDAKRSASSQPNGIAPTNSTGKIFRFARIVTGVFRRMRRQRGHGIFSTCFEETVHTSSGLFFLIKQLVKDGWDRSKEIVEDPFQGNGNLAGGIALLDELARLDSASKASGKTRKVFLVGSSTGTILLCNLLQKIGSDHKYSNLSLNIVFTAPSCTIVHFSDAIRASSKNILSFHLFGLKDKDERSAGIPIVYPGSVLYLASSICESKDKFHDEPLLGLNRFYQSRYVNNRSLTNRQQKALENVNSFFGLEADGRSKKITWSNQRSLNPMTSNTAMKHSAVIRNKEVQNSIKVLLSEKIETLDHLKDLSKQ